MGLRSAVWLTAAVLAGGLLLSRLESAGRRALPRPDHLASQPQPRQRLQRFADCRLVASPANDGDSFLVDVGERVLHVRLYFVDAPETRDEPAAMARRVRAQRADLGLADTAAVLRLGARAAARTRQALAAPFTVETAFQHTPGDRDRYYAFVRLADGEDLAALLVREGLARVYGYAHDHPDGRDAARVRRDLRALAAGSDHRSLR